MPNRHCLLLAALVAVSACSRAPQDAASAAASRTPANVGNVCQRKLLSPDDVGAMLRIPATTTRELPGDAQSCYFVGGADPSAARMLVTLRPGLGRATLDAYTSGKMKDYVSSKPLGGVGEEAVWVSDLHEIEARRGDWLCVVQSGDLSDTLRKAGEAAEQRALGALCNKIFGAL